MATHTPAIDRVGPGTQAVPPADPSVAAARTATSVTHPQSAVDVDVIPSTPPDEVMAAIARASAACDALAARGQHVSFGLNGGRLSIELQDQSGRPISGMTPSDALRLADGERE